MRSQACNHRVGQIQKFEENEESMKLFYQRANNRLPIEVCHVVRAPFCGCGPTF